MHMPISFTHRFCAISLLALTGVLSGCASLVKPRLPDVFKDPPPGGKTNGTYSLSAFNTDFAAYTAATLNATPTEPAATTARNKMVYGVLAEIDYVYHNYEIALFMNEGSFKVATDVLQLGLGMASTITNGARSKTVLSAVLTGVTGTSLSIDKNFFRQQTVQALISSMQAGRDRLKAIIIQRLNDPVTSYPFQAARSDLAAYFFAGTLPGALQQLNQTAAAKADDQRIALNNIQLTDVKTATNFNKAVAAAFKTTDLSKVIVFLQAMGVSVDENSSSETVEKALRDLSNKVIDDPSLRQKYFVEARKAALIQ
jgi:hypothetical protein